MKNYSGSSIIEVAVIITILSIGIIGVFSILNSGMRLADTSENRTKAINIAREGIEAIENIRDTNWIKFPSNYERCWNVDNYEPLCLGAVGPTYDIGTGSYVVIQDPATKLWGLKDPNVSNSNLINTNYILYKSKFPVYIDSNGFTTQEATYSDKCSTFKEKECITIFTREIKILYPGISPYKKMNVESKVSWIDKSKSTYHSISLKTTLTNWKIDL